MESNLKSGTQDTHLACARQRECGFTVPGRRAILLGLAGVAFGCSRSEQAQFGIEFTRVPQADDGGRAKNDIIEGFVTAPPGQRQLVLYAKSGIWWIQPLVSRPFTRIQPNLKFVSATHLGTEYAALLVEPGFRPAPTMKELPKVRGSVAAVAVVKGAKTAPSPSIQFSGYEWRLRSAPSSRGGKSNPYDPANIFTDAGGAVHLRLKKIQQGWSCAEMSLTQSLGYGTYSFTVRDVSRMEPAAVFTMFTWDYAKPDQSFSEVDIEISRWGNPKNENGQYILQPYYVPANSSRFTMPAGPLKHILHWEPGRFMCKTVSNSGSAERVVGEHSFVSQVPTPGIESVRMNLYVMPKPAVALKDGAEVVVERFEYLP